jgi:RecB family exonuclease
LIALAQPETTSEDLTSTVSASRLNTFHGCRLRYNWTYIDKLAAPSTPSLHIGKSVHEILRRFNVDRWKGEICSTDELREAFLEYWSGEQKANPVEWGDDEDAKREQAWKLALTYLENNPVPVNEAIEGVEVRLETELPGRPTKLIGVLDLIRSGGRIVDYKTASITPRNETAIRHAHSLQLTAYSLLYADGTGSEPSAMEIHTIVKLKSPRVVTTLLPAPNQRQKDRFFRAVDSWAEGVSSGDWVASPGLQCGSCPHFARCTEYGGCK